MNKINFMIRSFLIVGMIIIMSGCSSEKMNAVAGGNANNEIDEKSEESEERKAVEEKKKFANSTPENDTDTGLKVIKIDTAEEELTDDQKTVIEYFDQDYLRIWDYEAIRRYPQIFDGAQINVAGVVVKILSMDSEQYELVIWMNVCDEDGPWDSEQYEGEYLLLSGKTGEEWFMEGDVLDVYGRSNGVSTVSIDGGSYTVPNIEVQRAYQPEYDGRDGIIFAIQSQKFDLPFIKSVANIVLGDDIEIRKPTVGVDIPEEMAMIYDDYLGVDITDVMFVVELDNQSNAKFTRFLFPEEGGYIEDVKDAMADYESGYQRYFEFAADFQHFFLFTYDQGLEMLTLEYYDTSFNKIWKREFMETTSAQYDYTKNNIYLTANNELYIINIETGEDTYDPAYIGSKVALRKVNEGILMISNDRSDGIIMADLGGSIKWKTNLENDVSDVEGLQIVDDRIIFCYSGMDKEETYVNTYVAIDRESGDILSSFTN